VCLYLSVYYYYYFYCLSPFCLNLFCLSLFCLSPVQPTFCVSHIINKHWRSMTMNPLMKEIFPQPPMVGFRQPPNLKKTLCYAKVPEQIGRINRIQAGLKKCNKSGCRTCPFIVQSNTVNSKQSNTSVHLSKGA
jgi:hypothetical protein